VAFLATELAIGRLPDIPDGDGEDAWIAIVHCLMFGALLGSLLAAAPLVQRSLDGLRANFPDTDPSAFGYRPIPITGLAVSGIAGFVAIGVCAPFLTTPFPWLPSLWTPEVYWHRLIGPPMGALMGMTLHVFFRGSTLVSRAATRLGPVDVFAPERFAPVVRHGLANGLLAVILASLGGMFLVDPGQLQAVGPVMAIMLPFMVAAMLLPVWGARTRIREEKQREMQWALEGIREARGQEPVDVQRLGDLSAYHDIVDRAPEWPFTQSAVARAAAYFLIPAMAWLGAVLLEALLQATLLG
jgi:hypothetical protein